MENKMNINIEEKEFEILKDRTWNTISQAQENFRNELLKQKVEQVYNSSSQIEFVESVLDDLGRNVEELNFETQYNLYNTDESILYTLLISERNKVITASKVISIAERYWEKCDGCYEYGGDDFSYFLENYLLPEFNLDSIIDEIEKDIRTKNVESVEQIINKINQALIDYKNEALSQGIEQVYDNASKIFFFNNVLGEFISRICFLCDQEKPIYYNRVDYFLMELVITRDRESITPSKILHAVEDYWNKEEGYIIGSEDFSNFFENYIAPEFNLKPSFKHSYINIFN